VIARLGVGLAQALSQMALTSPSPLDTRNRHRYQPGENPYLWTAIYDGP
jgi:hypothetical protein